MEFSLNIDHIATLREARKENFPDPIYGAVEAELAGADGITVHLRGDRRHIKERDLRLLREIMKTELNLEMAPTQAMSEIAISIKPDRITLVPETAGEITTQGGLNLLNIKEDLNIFISNLKQKGINVGVFLDPDPEQLKEATRIGAQYVEINTNEFSKLKRPKMELINIARFAKAARREGLSVHAGHGIDYRNIRYLLTINEIISYSIGFAIIARAIFVGLRQAVSEMAALIKRTK